MGVPTPNAGLTIPTIGGDAGPLFAQEINGNFNILDSIYGGVNTLSVAGNVSVTATPTQALNLVQQLTGQLTGPITYFLPAVGAFYAIENATTGGFQLSVGCTGGANTLAIPAGLSTWVWTDGSVIRVSNPPGWQELANYTASGANTLLFALPASFRRFKLTLQNVLANIAGAQLCFQVSYDGGASFQGGYAFLGESVSPANSAAITPFGVNPAAALPVSGVGPTSTFGIDASFEIYPGSSSSFAKYRGSCFDNVTVGTQLFQIGGTSLVNGLATAGRILPVLSNVAAAGTFSGTFIIEGLP